MALGADYLKELKKRSLETHVHKEFQLIGLEIADMLGDRKHKALYIKLAKQFGRELMLYAKEVSEKKGVKNRGAYFMSVVGELRRKPKSEIYKATAASATKAKPSPKKKAVPKATEEKKTRRKTKPPAQTLNF